MLQQKRIIVFIFGCILVRTILVLLAKNLNKNYVKLMGYIAIPIGLSFWYLYLVGNARADAQLEWLGDKKVWWNELRPIHGTIYLLFALFAIQQKSFAWMFLALDVIIGLIAWLYHHELILK